MKFVIIGYGIQGRKRKKSLGINCVAVVDKKNVKESDYRNINQVPLYLYQSVVVCVPEDEKYKIINFCIKNNKHILVEKPLIFSDPLKIKKIEKRANKNNVFILSGYNHRYEKSIVLFKSILKKKKIGKNYFCKIKYLNGTAKNVYKTWRDKKNGVLNDIGPHVIDLIFFLFGEGDFKKINFFYSRKYENLSNDHVVFGFVYKKIDFIIEISYCTWKNYFEVDLNGSKGSCRLSSLVKWGYSKIIFFKRVIPSGIPIETKYKFTGKDNSWKNEILKFKELVKKRTKTNLNRDYLINKIINQLQ
jgi:predicted dehydrogenase